MAADQWRRMGESYVRALTTEIDRKAAEAEASRAAAVDAPNAVARQHMQQAEWCEMLVELCRERKAELEAQLAGGCTGSA
jgi:hypothetical protein